MSFQTIIRPILFAFILAIVVLIALLTLGQIDSKLFYILLGIQISYFLFNLLFVFMAIKSSKNQVLRNKVMLSFMASYLFFSLALFLSVSILFSLDGKTIALSFIASYLLAKIAAVICLNTVEKHY